MTFSFQFCLGYDRTEHACTRNGHTTTPDRSGDQLGAGPSAKTPRPVVDERRHRAADLEEAQVYVANIEVKMMIPEEVRRLEGSE
jgi:hypothetical protein